MLSALKPTQLVITSVNRQWGFVCPPCEAHIRDADAEIISKSPMSECATETSLRQAALEADAVFSIEVLVGDASIHKIDGMHVVDLELSEDGQGFVVLKMKLEKLPRE
jgi:hypothetical protein